MTCELFAYVVEPDLFANFVPEHEADLDLFIDGFDSRPMEAEWPAPRVRLSDAARKARVPEPDFAYGFGSVPILSAAAVKALQPMLDENGELLSLTGHPRPYWALNITTVLDVMDEDRSSGDWIAPGRLATLKQLVLKDENRAAPLPAIFKLPQMRKGRAVITDEILRLVETHGLTGLAPTPLGPPNPST